MFFNSSNNKYPKLKYNEKRSRPRSICDIPALVQEIDDSYIYKADIFNNNNKGLYFETNIRMNPGKKIYIGIDESSSGTHPQTYHAEILWVKRLTNSNYNYGYGAIYIHGMYNRKSEDLNFAGEAELRKNARRRFCKPVFIILVKDYYHGRSKDISRGGMFIETLHRLSIGQSVKLVIPGTKIDKGVMLKGKVVHINQDGMGIRFTKLIKAKTAQKHKK